MFGYENVRTQYKNTGNKLSFFVRKKKKKSVIPLRSRLFAKPLLFLSRNLDLCSSNNNEFVRLKILCVKVIMKKLFSVDITDNVLG